MTAWRRPLAAISEIQLSRNAFDWVPADEPAETVTPGYVLAIGQDMVEVPLPSPWRRGQPPDARPVIDLLVARWRSTQS